MAARYSRGTGRSLNQKLARKRRKKCQIIELTRQYRIPPRPNFCLQTFLLLLSDDFSIVLDRFDSKLIEFLAMIFSRQDAVREDRRRNLWKISRKSIRIFIASSRGRSGG